MLHNEFNDIALIVSRQTQIFNINMSYKNQMATFVANCQFIFK